MFLSIANKKKMRYNISNIKSEVKMKRLLSFVLLLALAVPLLASCETNPSGENSGESLAESQTEESGMIPDENAKILWNEAFADKASGFENADEVYKLTAYSDGKELESFDSVPDGDNRYIFEGEDKTRVAVLSEGYALTLPGTNIEADFSLGALRSKYKGEGYVLTVTYEDQNPYGDNEKGFKIYYDEWLARYLENVEFLTENSIRRTRAAGSSETLLPGFVVNYYDMQINLASKMEYDYYSIAIVRPADSYEHFWLFVLKSDKKMTDEIDAVVASFKELEKKGTPVNSVGSYELKIPEFWNEETKAYYNKIQNQTTVDFGAFYEKNDPEYVKWLASEEALNNELDIFMTYYHIGWYGSNYTKTDIDLNFLNAQAGGNGFNGKPVLELTYQFTTTNNGLGGYTPMYDICRGRVDAQFRQLAKDIKAYGKPVLFRLNNEMNTDWTSYCGMQTMLDPDVFIDTWRRLYDIFKEEGVDNCIWIWNPIATSCPYSNWGDQLNYWPGSDYVQMLGLTYYQMNNDNLCESFRQMYTELYEKNTPWFDNFPAILGEFACGAGASVVYDWDKQQYVPADNIELKRQWQADWIKGMFDCFEKNQNSGYEFCKNIKIAVWFSANDYVDINGVSTVNNYLRLDEGVPLALQAFREGYAALKARREEQ